MEKITVKIGAINKRSTKYTAHGNTPNNNALWLSKALEISYKRALGLLIKAQKETISNAVDYIYVDLNYRQLGRYTAFRRKDLNTTECWKYPHVISYEEDTRDKEGPVIELRPGYRKC